MVGKKKGKMSTKDYRLEEFENCACRSAHPCNRCLGSIAEGNLEGKNGKLGCRFVEMGPGKGDEMSWLEFKFEDSSGNKVQIFRCEYCHGLGQDCFAVSGSL
jgi:hypothetical protein